MGEKTHSTSEAKKEKERARLTGGAEMNGNAVDDAAAAAVSAVASSSSPAASTSPSTTTTTTRTAGFMSTIPPDRSDPQTHSSSSSTQTPSDNPVEMGWKLDRIIADMQITPVRISQLVAKLSSLPSSSPLLQRYLPRAATTTTTTTTQTQTNTPARSETPTITVPTPTAAAADDDEDTMEPGAIANQHHHHTASSSTTTTTPTVTMEARQTTNTTTTKPLSPGRRFITHLTRAITLAASSSSRDHSSSGAVVPSQLATAAVAAGERVRDANRGPRLLALVERVELLELCRIPFLMPLIAGFFAEVCGIVLREETDEACLRRVVAFEWEVDDAVEERVGTEEFEWCCKELGVWEESDVDDDGELADEEEEEEEEGGGHVWGQACEDRGGNGEEGGEGMGLDDDKDGDTEGEDCDDNSSDEGSNPFEGDDDDDDDDDDGQAPRPTIFWRTRAAPGEDHHLLFKRAMGEVNERLTFIEHVIGRGIRSVAMQCDGSPATQFYNFYIPATRSILSDLAEEKTREITKARERSGRPEPALPNPTNLDPMRFHSLRLIFLGDHPELAATMQDKKLDKEHRRDTMHVFWQNAVIEQKLSEEELTEFCDRLREQGTFDEISEYIPTLQMDQ